MLIVIYTVCVVITAMVGGMISDRIGKRKMIVTLSGALRAWPRCCWSFVETWPAAMVAAVLFGAGFGAYLAVDQALITQVLPAAADRAKDLGIINIAIVGPSAVGAVLAGALVTRRQLPHAVRGHGRGRGARLDPGLADQERAVATCPSAAGRTGPRPTRASCLLCATSAPAASQTSASSSNHPPPTWRQRAATRSGPGTGTARMYQVSSTVGAQPVAPRPNTTGGRPSTARASS